MPNIPDKPVKYLMIIIEFITMRIKATAVKIDYYPVIMDVFRRKEIRLSYGAIEFSISLKNVSINIDNNTNGGYNLLLMD